MQEVLGRLGKWNELSDTDIQVIESFSAVNDARLEMLLSKYKPKGRNDSLLANLKKKKKKKKKEDCVAILCRFKSFRFNFP